MSKAYIAFKNFNWNEMLNILCFSVKNPETLTHNQRLTRLYRSTLRRYQAHKLEGYRTDFQEYLKAIHQAKIDFTYMKTLNPDSVEFQTYMEKYIQLQEDLYDPVAIVDDCRPYAPTSTRYLIFDEHSLSIDPFGYYSPRLVSDRRPEVQQQFYADYPMNDSHWNLWETFPENFDDTDYASQQAETINQKGK